MAKIIGIDPGLASTGVGIVSGKATRIESYSYGSIHTSKEKSLPSRLDQIFSQVIQVLENENPDIMVVEDIFSLEKYPKSAIALGKVTGVILLAGCRFNLPVIEIPVREAKKVLTGNGQADKIQLEKSVRYILNLKSPIRPFHASDAMALALIGFFRYQNGLRDNME